MNIVLVESSSKAKSVKNILASLGMAGDIQVGFTAGRVFDYKINDLSHQWAAVNHDTLTYLRSSIKNSDSVIAMTDSDEQGEYIAFQLQTLANEYGKAFAKADLNELTQRGIDSALRSVRPLNMTTVAKVHTERLLNLKIAQYGLKQGLGPTSVHQMMVANHLLNEPTLNQANVRVGRHIARTLSNESTLSLATANLHEVAAKPCSTYNLMTHSALEGGEPLIDVAKETQELYENGLCSYSRVDSQEWYPSAEDSVRGLVESQGFIFEQGLFRAMTNTDQPHSALYLVKPDLLLSNRPATNIISDITNATQKIVFEPLYQGDAGGPILSVSAAVAQEGLTKASPEQRVLQALKELDLYKPSNCAMHANKLSSAFFNENKLDRDLMHQHQSFTNQHFPTLVKHVEERTNPINTIALDGQVEHSEQLGNQKAQEIFDNLTMSL